MADQLECRLEADPEYLLGQETAIRVYLTNPGNESVRVLKWNTPLEGIRSNHFIVTKDKQRLPYDGIYQTRRSP
ncbi:MAG TPA: hypothetical protein VFY67_08845 [Pyrinomonadaceae bacterium]|nr:hypothetical protein [Pyrinomonadaceae bacterium]